MPYKSKLPPEVKVVIVEDYLSGKKGYRQTLREYNITDCNLSMWVQLYETRGRSGLSASRTKRKYSNETKLLAINDYLEGRLSLMEICKKYDITSHSMVQNWIKKYNSHEEFNRPNTGGVIYMAKGRTTTYEERVEIVSHCISNNKDYGKTIEQYGVSYQQIYSWVRKYEKEGPESLTDRRGRRKIETSMTEVEKLRAQVKLKEAENLRLKMENELLKKLEALERGWKKD